MNISWQPQMQHFGKCDASQSAGIVLMSSSIFTLSIRDHMDYPVRGSHTSNMATNRGNHPTSPTPRDRSPNQQASGNPFSRQSPRLYPIDTPSRSTQVFRLFRFPFALKNSIHFEANQNGVERAGRNPQGIHQVTSAKSRSGIKFLQNTLGCR